MINNEDNKFINILNSILKLEFIKGNKKWTISDLSRSCNSSRALIYYYFEHKDKEIMLFEAWNYLLKMIYALEEDDQKGIVERTYQALEMSREHPYLLVLFMQEKNKDQTEISKLIQEKESDFLDMMKRLYPEWSTEDIEKKYLIQLGIIIRQQAMTKEEIQNKLF